MLGVDPEIGASGAGVAATAALLLVAFCLLAAFAPRIKAGAAARVSVVLLAALVGATIARAFFDRTGIERQALERRFERLNMESLAPGSALACLDALVGEGVGAACERVVFASPATLATAVSYVSARLALLADMTDYVARGGRGIDGALLPLRRSLEADRFGLVAHVLAMRDGCTSRICSALALLDDPERVRADLGDAVFDRHLNRYVAAWPKVPEGQVAAAAEKRSVAALRPVGQGPPGQSKVLVNIDFPSSSSIPPISIMNPEPSGPVLPGVAAAAAANPNPRAAAAAVRRIRKQTRHVAVRPRAQADASLAAPAVEPVWPEPMPAAPAAVAPARPGAPSSPAVPYAMPRAGTGVAPAGQ